MIKIKVVKNYYVIYDNEKEIIKISRILNTLDNVIKSLGVNKDEIEIVNVE